MTSHDLIFSQAQVKAADSIDVKSPLRFSGGFNLGEQFHVDLSRSFGMYTGLQLRNVGFISKIDTLRLKHRAYALGVPVALKFGKIDSKIFLATGAEAEFMLNYKVKEFIRGKKVFKDSEWFSDKVEMFNPSVFLQINLGGWGNVKVKYYLKDFLKPVDPNEGYRLKGGAVVPAYTQESKLFYISWGSTFLRKKKNRKQQDDAKPPVIEQRRNDA